MMNIVLNKIVDLKTLKDGYHDNDSGGNFMKLITISIIFLTIILSGCINERFGTDIPKNIEVTKLVDILNNSQAFQDKKVLLEGIFSGACESLCEFTYQEDGRSVLIYPKGFKLKKLKKGQPIRVYAEIKVGEENVVISALGMEER